MDNRINPFLFSVQLADALDIPDNKVGIVTTRERLALASSEIAGRVVQGHSMYQSPQVFIDGKGSKGLQEQVLLRVGISSIRASLRLGLSI